MDLLRGDKKVTQIGPARADDALGTPTFDIEASHQWQQWGTRDATLRALGCPYDPILESAQT
jgi:hypothetical protein